MKSIKDLIEKLKILDVERYNVRCSTVEWSDTSETYKYHIFVKPHSIDGDFHIMVCFFNDGVSVKLTDVQDFYWPYPYCKTFEKETYSKKEEAELRIVLEEIKEYSDASMLNKLNSFLK